MHTRPSLMNDLTPSISLRWAPLIAAAIFFTVAFCTASPLRAQTNVRFTTPVNVSQDSTGYDPQMVVDSAGNVFIAYLDTDPAVDSYTPWLARGTFSGGAFHASSAPVEVSPNAAANLSIAVRIALRRGYRLHQPQRAGSVRSFRRPIHRLRRNIRVRH